MEVVHEEEEDEEEDEENELGKFFIVRCMIPLTLSYSQIPQQQQQR